MNTQYKSVRKRLLVEPRVQGALVLRVVFYWFFCLLAIALMLLCWRIVTGPARIFYRHFDDMWFFYGPPAIASLLLLPLVILDVLRLSNRFAGPMLRLRRAMQAAARGQQVEPLEFRKGDFWREFAEDFNRLLSRIESQESKLPVQQQQWAVPQAQTTAVPSAVPAAAPLAPVGPSLPQQPSEASSHL